MPSPEGECGHVPAGQPLNHALRIDGADLDGATACLAGARSLLEGELGPASAAAGSR
jgi:hypothetical protein